MDVHGMGRVTVGKNSREVYMCAWVGGEGCGELCGCVKSRDGDVRKRGQCVWQGLRWVRGGGGWCM